MQAQGTPRGQAKQAASGTQRKLIKCQLLHLAGRTISQFDSKKVNDPLEQKIKQTNQ